MCCVRTIGVLLLILYTFYWKTVCAINSTIVTIPNLVNDSLASGYTGLTFVATFLRDNDDECRWNIENYFSAIIFSSTISCPRSSGNPSCQIFDGDRVTTKFTFNKPITTNLSVAIGCPQGFKTEEKLIIAKDCSSTTMFTVMSQSSLYDSEGTAKCNNGGTIFYPNGTQPESTRTKCLVTAVWSRLDEFECWSAPTVNIEGNITAVEGSSLSFQCLYTDVHPVGSLSIFRFKDTLLYLSKGNSYTIPFLSRLDNNQSISCQAHTPYTERATDTGLSQMLYLDVKYPPYQEEPNKCTWNASKLQLCQITFQANAEVQLINVIKNGILAEGIVSTLTKKDEYVFQLFYIKENASQTDGGIYQVLLHSVPTVNTNQTVSFEIEFIENPEEPNELPLDIIFLAVAAFLGVYSITITISVCVRGKKKKEKLTLVAEQDENGYMQPIRSNLKAKPSQPSSIEENTVSRFTINNEAGKEKTNKKDAPDAGRYENVSKSDYETIPDTLLRTSPNQESGYDMILPQTKL